MARTTSKMILGPISGSALSRSVLFSSLITSGCLASAGLAQEATESKQAAPAAQIATEHIVPGDVDSWSDGIWSAAMAGDAPRMEAYLDSIPETSQPERAKRLREAVESYQLHLDAANVDRSEDREAALERLKELFAEEKIVEALTAAVELQTLSDNWNEALELEELSQLLLRALLLLA